MEWLNSQVEKHILEIREFQQIGRAVNEAWTNKYITASYTKGLGKARGQMRNMGIPVTPDELEGGLTAVMNKPVHLDRLGMLFTRTFTSLRNITAEMDTQISTILAQGLADGMNPRSLARMLNHAISGKGSTLGLPIWYINPKTGARVDYFMPPERRATILARTEIIRAHAEAQLQEFENWGVAGVTVQAEWITAGDNRVCFPDYIKVKTIGGDIPINELQISDKVLTPEGYKNIYGKIARTHEKGMTTVHFSNGHLFCTDDHPIWSNDRKTWIAAKNLMVNELIKSDKNELVNVNGIINFTLGKSNGTPALFINGKVTSSVMQRIMPIFPVTFNGNEMVYESKVNRKSANLIFFDVIKSKPIKSQSYFTFNACLPIETTVTGKRAKQTIFRGGFTKNFATIFTNNSIRRPPAFLRAIYPVNISLNIRSFMKEYFAAPFASFVNTSIAFDPAFDRTKFVPMFNTFFNNKIFTAPRTFFINNIAVKRFITTNGTKNPIFIAGSECMSAITAFTGIDRFVAFYVAFMRTKNTGKFFRIISSPVKRFTAMIADKIINNYSRSVVTTRRAKFSLSRPGLEIFTTLITGDQKHITIELIKTAKEYINKTLKVYDISVEKARSFYANGILVHNCDLCAPREGEILTIEQARGQIPFHPQCRCAWLPYVPKDGKKPKQPKPFNKKIKKPKPDNRNLEKLPKRYRVPWNEAKTIKDATKQLKEKFNINYSGAVPKGSTAEELLKELNIIGQKMSELHKYDTVITQRGSSLFNLKLSSTEFVKNRPWVVGKYRFYVKRDLWDLNELHLSKYARQRLKEEMSIGSHGIGNDLSTVFTHEYGHHIYYTSLWKEERDMVRQFYYGLKKAPDGSFKTFRPILEQEKYIKNNVSQYAAEMHEEFFAELFCAYFNGLYTTGSPGKYLTKELIDFFETVMGIQTKL